MKKTKKKCKKIGIQCQFVDICNSNIEYNSKFSDILKTVKKVDLDTLLFLLFRNRKICKKEGIHFSRLKKYIQQYKSLNCDYFVFSQMGSSETLQRYKEISSGRADAPPPSTLDNDIKRAVEKDDDLFVVVLYKSTKDLHLYLQTDMADRQIHERNRTCGRLFGYPECCINQFEKYQTNKKIPRDLRGGPDLFGVFGKQTSLCPLINEEIKLFWHRPCSLDCKKTISMAQEVLTYYSGKFGEDMLPAYFGYTKNGLGDVRKNEKSKKSGVSQKGC